MKKFKFAAVAAALGSLVMGVAARAHDAFMAGPAYKLGLVSYAGVPRASGVPDYGDVADGRRSLRRFYGAGRLGGRFACHPTP